MMRVFILLMVLFRVSAEEAILTGQSNALMLIPRMLKPYRIHKFARLGQSITRWTEEDYFDRSVEGVDNCSVLFFIQGERDNKDGMTATEYYDHLVILMNKYRSLYPGIIIVIHRISGEVGAAQEQYADDHVDTVAVFTGDLGGIHYFGKYRIFAKRLLLAAGAGG